MLWLVLFVVLATFFFSMAITQRKIDEIHKVVVGEQEAK